MVSNKSIFAVMNIGFDAKRAFHNSTGLGVFSRVLINLLAEHFPQNDYFLYNPKPGQLFTPAHKSLHEKQPDQLLHQLLRSWWRTKWITNDLIRDRIDVYHGLSHEIPLGMGKTNIKSIVTMHDMFPEMYPNEYSPIDVKIYTKKTRYACENANRIMATSEETKRNIIEFYKTAPCKIEVIYQTYNPLFAVIQNDSEKEKIKEKYNLPDRFFLHVGTIIPRKNLLNICKALHILNNKIDLPVVVIGRGNEYKKTVQQYIHDHHLEKQVIFLSDKLKEAGKNPFVETEDIPAIFQMSEAMVYPSFYEGFGIPVVEALAGGTPVITSNTSCLPEVGGDAAYLVNPSKPEEIAEGLKKIFDDPQIAHSMKQKGLEHVKKFAPEVYVSHVMRMYESVLKD